MASDLWFAVCGLRSGVYASGFRIQHLGYVQDSPRSREPAWAARECWGSCLPRAQRFRQSVVERSWHIETSHYQPSISTAAVYWHRSPQRYSLRVAITSSSRSLLRGGLRVENLLWRQEDAGVLASRGHNASRQHTRTAVERPRHKQTRSAVYWHRTPHRYSKGVAITSFRLSLLRGGL